MSCIWRTSPGRRRRHLGLRVFAVLALAWTTSRGVVAAPPAEPPGPRVVAQTTSNQFVGRVVLSPDGRLLASSTDEQRVRLWDVETGRELWQMPAASTRTCNLAFSPDSSRLAVTRKDVGAALYECATGAELRRFGPDLTDARSVCFGAGGATVLVGTEGGKVCVFDSGGSGKPARLVHAHTTPVVGLALAPDGEGWISASARGEVKRWSRDGRTRAEYTGGAGLSLVGLAVSSRGDLLAAGTSEGDVLLWKVGQPYGTEHVFEARADGAIQTVAFSPDGSLLAVAHLGGALRIWDVATGNAMRRLNEGGDGANLARSSIAFTADGTGILAADGGGRMEELSVVTGARVRGFPSQGQGIASGGFSADGRLLALLGAYDVGVKLLDARTGELVRQLDPLADGMACMALAPDGRHVLVAGATGPAQILDVDTGEPVRALPDAPGGVCSAAFTPDGYRVATGSKDGLVHVWSTATGQSAAPLPGHTGEVVQLSISQRGDRLLSSGADKTLRVWDLRDGSPVCVCAAPTLRGPGCLSPDGKTVLGLLDRLTVGVWSADSGKLLRRLEVEPEGPETEGQTLESLGLSPDGSLVALGTNEAGGYVLEVKSGKQRARLLGGARQLRWVAFSPDGRFVLGGGNDPTARIWQVASGQLACEVLPCWQDPYGWCVFEPHGRWFAPRPRQVEGAHWAVGTRAVALDGLGDGLLSAGLLAECLGNRPPQARPTTSEPPPRPPPSVKVTAPVVGKVAVHLELEDRGGGIGRVAVHLNGKRVRDDARGGTVESRASSAKLDVDLSDDPRVRPGCPNCVEVLAFDAQGRTTQRGVAIVQDDRTPSNAPPELWAVVCGVSDFADDGAVRDLTYACKDARAIADALRIAAEGQFGAERTHVTLLLSPGKGSPPLADGEQPATLDGLRAALAALKACKPDDVVVVYLAGHGVVGRAGKGDYGFLLREAKTLDVGPGGEPPPGSLTGRELSEALRALPAARQAVVLDTCAADGLRAALGAIAPEDAGSTARLLAPLGVDAGACFLAGCGATKSSLEDDRLKHGLLTYALLESLSCGCRLGPSGDVVVEDLFHHARTTVIKWTSMLRLPDQVPLVRTEGEPFSIGRMGPEARAQIVLETPAPVFVRPAFLQGKRPFDKLGLGRQASALLESGAPEGAPPFAVHPVVYLDVEDQPGAFRLWGSYEVTGGRLKADVTLSRLGYGGSETDVATFPIEGPAGTKAEKDALAEQVVRRALEALAKASPR